LWEQLAEEVLRGAGKQLPVFFEKTGILSQIDD
jgi:hypothetical protein